MAPLLPPPMASWAESVLGGCIYYKTVPLEGDHDGRLVKSKGILGKSFTGSVLASRMLICAGFLRAPQIQYVVKESAKEIKEITSTSLLWMKWATRLKPEQQPDPNGTSNIHSESIKYGIHNWAQHGICGSGVLLGVVNFYTDRLGTPPYDRMAAHAILLTDLLASAEAEGVTFQQADILVIRAGFIGPVLTRRCSAGIDHSEDAKRFLWDTHFAVMASGTPTTGPRRDRGLRRAYEASDH
ncbi:uncharacterized protein BXZ73DRAFT_83905 [Epithele typhae]|uniref:uncharacterized protein n=1 Tax=Epithele typhae TaxID=378194 RepID=UPI0020082707|nr:uncharacterized protein BXZ73DRAFT_83905 [Epithele typhae]KAH9910197.1 hypothetical protein BXZ73DRAFT_83905 [Epithele typhae]